MNFVGILKALDMGECTLVVSRGLVYHVVHVQFENNFISKYLKNFKLFKFFYTFALQSNLYG